MRTFVTLAFIGMLAVGVASCGNSQQGSNSAGNLIPVDSLVGPTALEARAPGGGGGKGGGKGGGGTTGGSGSLSLVMVTDINGNGSPNWGDSVTFNVSSTAAQPQLSLTCTQNGATVYQALTGYWDGYPWPWTRTMTLSSGAWTGGAASCTAQLYYSNDGVRNYNLASLTFAVGA